MFNARKSYFLLLFVLLTACFPLTNHSLNKLNTNKTRSEVVKIMGKPYSTNLFYNKEYMVYYIHRDFFDLFFVKKFPFIGFYPLLRTGERYWVILENGYVVSYGASDGYKNNIPRALNSKGTIIIEK